MIPYSRISSIVCLLLAIFLLDACKVKRCPLDNCHIRMKHRHPSMMGGGKGESAPLVYDANAGPEANLGPVYRGIPWWQFYRETKVQPGSKNYKTVRTRDPKIGQGYKPGYKYKHKDSKPWSERMKKYKEKKIEDKEKEDRKGGKESEGEEIENQEDTGDEPSEEVKPAEKPAPAEDVENAEEEAPKKQKKEKQKKERKPKAKKEKKSKQKVEKTEESEETEEEGF